MIPANALVTQLQAYFKTTDIPLIQLVDPIQDIQALFTVGEQVRAQVTSQLPSGRYAVMVKDQLLDLNLPRNTEAGQSLDMRVVANTPRLTFLLTQAPAQSPQTPTQAPKDGSTEVDLSQTAKWIGELLTESATQHESGIAKTATSLAPLFDGKPPDTLKLAESLKQALTETGLFYESHLADWAEGKRTTADIMREPPAAWAQAGQKPATATTAPKADAEAAMAKLEKMEATLLGAKPASEKDIDDSNTAAAFSRGSHELEGMPPNARQLVQQQLQTLDQRQLQWQGQAWPGQAMQWQVEEDGQRHMASDETPGSVWRTRLQLHLPKLGDVDVLISLRDRRQVEVGFSVGDASTADKIRDGQRRLALQLDAAGLELTANQVAVIVDPSVIQDE